SIGLLEFSKLMPAEPGANDGPPESIFSPATAPPLASAAATAASSAGAVAARSQAAAPAPVDAEVAKLKEQLSRHPQDERPRGTSALQMRIGLFRLIQGAAYRSFRES